MKEATMSTEPLEVHGRKSGFNRFGLLDLLYLLDLEGLFSPTNTSELKMNPLKCSGGSKPFGPFQMNPRSCSGGFKRFGSLLLNPSKCSGGFNRFGSRRLRLRYRFELRLHASLSSHC